MRKEKSKGVSILPGIVKPVLGESGNNPMQPDSRILILNQDFWLNSDLSNIAW